MCLIRKSLFSLILLFTTLLFVQCNKCNDVECQNGGTCSKGLCSCPTGFTGPECNREDRAQYIGIYTVTGACASNGNSYITIQRNETRGDRITIKNLDDKGIDVVAKANLIEITITEQTFMDGTIEGTGKFVDDILEITYTVKRPSTTYTCVAKCAKS